MNIYQKKSLYPISNLHEVYLIGSLGNKPRTRGGVQVHLIGSLV